MHISDNFIIVLPLPTTKTKTFEIVTVYEIVYSKDIEKEAEETDAERRHVTRNRIALPTPFSSLGSCYSKQRVLYNI